MTRTLSALVACATLLLVAGPARADGPPAGRWKFHTSIQGQGRSTPITFLFAFSETDGKWAGDYLGSFPQLDKEPKFSAVQATATNLSFTVMIGKVEFVSFEGVVSKDGKKISGSYKQLGGPLQITELMATNLKKMSDPFEVAREALTTMETGPELFEAGIAVLGAAGAKKLPADEVRGIADKLTKAAAGYGSRWEFVTAINVATTLSNQAGLADVAVAQARRAERMLTDDSPLAAQLEVFETLDRALGKAGKADEAKKYAANVQKLVARDYAEYSKKELSFLPGAFAGRKGKSDRAVLVEVFTGAECPPCVGADIACDGLLKFYKPTDVIVLNYHFHVPGPDPLTSPDGMERVETYAKLIEGAPTVIVDGKAGPEAGGPASIAKEAFQVFNGVIGKRLETDAGAKLTLTVAPAEKGFSAKAAVSDLAAPGEKVMLRFALTEERVRYVGGNGIRYHHNVVRAMPGGVKGVALTKKSQEHTVTFDPAAERARLTQYLDAFTATEKIEFPHPGRPMDLADLKLVAFVQNDATGEILQAVQVDVEKK
ncbi:hypothetical protein [Fimbriiglobus ruber]|uniref:Thioredoxin domain-containing protein n=1 Tax=Fimbriiglobus ruber TaxID=1908690 RepID=A0A225EAL6_9BACT|nr:hypothetical protein [Fimbriiglobus ruber]OWK45447.1 hypothetical protein FRUB_01778 [Fimbriiglobus ruber]